MRSATAFTDEIDLLEKACAELSAGIKAKLAFGKYSIGIVFCDADVAVDELGRLLHESLGIEIVGVTTTASIDREGGYHDMGIVLSVITADDVAMVAASTGNMEKDTYASLIRTAYDDAAARLGASPDFIYMGSPFLPDITSDSYLNVLHEASGQAPIFGGVATDHYDLKYQKTFHNGTAFTGGLVFVLFAGNIKPVFAMQHEFGGKTMSKGIVTQSSGNSVEKVGDRTFVEYISDISSVPDEETVIYHFQSTPFIMELPGYEQTEQPIVRALCTINHKTGSGGFLSNMPVGSVLSMNILQRENLKTSCDATLTNLKEQMRANPDYPYSLIFISTCNARHLLMGDTKDMEANIVQENLGELPADLCAVGFYGFGEICPTAISSEDKTAKNNFHNISFAVCAI